MGDRRLDAGHVRHIEMHHMGVTTRAFNLSTQGLESLGAAPSQHHRCTGPGQGQRKLGPQTTGGARHQGHAARQINAIAHE